MAIATADPARFQRYHEPFRATVVRTGLIALGLGSLGSIVESGHLPSSPTEAYAWLILVLSVFWISFGGHWVELAYLNVLRPRIARLPDWLLVVVRVGVWLTSGALLFLGIMTTRSLMIGQWPGQDAVRSALYYGGPIFAVIELVPHAVLAWLGRPSFWNLRG